MDKIAQQNIYDDEIFFEGYKKIRDNKINANNLFEIPALFSMLPDLKNKRVLMLISSITIGSLSKFVRLFKSNSKNKIRTYKYDKNVFYNKIHVFKFNCKKKLRINRKNE